MTATLMPARARKGPELPEVDLDAAPNVAGRRRVPELAAGVLVIAVFALAALWWQASADRSTEVLAIRDTVERGHVIDVGDLQIVGVSSADHLAVMTPTEAAAVVGRVARTDLAGGTLVNLEMFSAGSLLEQGQALVGLSLDAGEYPTLRLAAGDVVSVVDTAMIDGAAGPQAPVGVVMARRATVIDVEAVGVQGRLLVTVQLSEGEAARVASAAAAQHVRLIQVAEG